MQACWYSFRSASVGDIKTISIDQFDNQANIVKPGFNAEFTELLRDKFISQSSLNLVDKNADMKFTGFISDYSVQAINIQGNDVAAQNRLTISVVVRCDNFKYSDESWEQSFSNFSDYDISVPLGSVENDLTAEISEKIAQDIFNKAFGNW